MTAGHLGDFVPERLGGEVGAERGKYAEGDVDAEPSLPGPVDVLQVQQQGELVGDQGGSGAVGGGDRGMANSAFVTAYGDQPDAREGGDAEVVVMQVLPAGRDVAGPNNKPTPLSSGSEGGFIRAGRTAGR
ncbi:hypothetical protein [Streptomyces sp. RLB3-17]|uniref:hypothetical protein n=1 Tax=Streptomyces sp. RLB3-17 TaxID=2594455 RepID=UPI001966E38F|nr:hypothetical protein [Streptomyces sp. RLB3-17]